MAPSTLSFRASAPLDEFQEVTVNGETIDPLYYTLEEGSTIVKLNIDYLRTLDVGLHEISVLSNSQTATGDFTVTAPEVNEYGFYYDNPYVTDYLELIIFHSDGTLIYKNTNEGWEITSEYTMTDDGHILFYHEGFEETVELIVKSKNLIINNSTNHMSSIWKIDSQLVAVDGDFFYIYNADKSRYEVMVVDTTKESYG
jgi:hypothetical protein